MSLTPRFLEFCHHSQPELGPSRLRDPQARHFFQPAHIARNRPGRSHCFSRACHRALELDGVQIHDGVDSVELPVLPRLHFLNHFVRHARDQCRRNFHVVNLFKMLLDLAC
jgi:hypothetical protein